MTWHFSHPANALYILCLRKTWCTYRDRKDILSMMFRHLLFHFMSWTPPISFKFPSPAWFMTDSTPWLFLVVFNSYSSNPQLTEQCLSLYSWTFNLFLGFFFFLFQIMLWFIFQVFIYNVLGTKHSRFSYPGENKWTETTLAFSVLTA